MLHIAIAIHVFLAAATITSAKPFPAASRLSRRDTNPFCYFGGHQPTEETYLQGVTQYCDNHVQDGISLGNKHEIVAVIPLKDLADRPVRWVYKMRWEDDAGFGPIGISHDMCVRHFHDFVDDSTCKDGLRKFVVGDNYWIYFENKRGSRLYFEQGSV